MKKSFFKALPVLVLFFTACQREVSLMPEKKQTSLPDFYKNNASPTRFFSISNTSGGTVATPAGTRVVFPANCFVTGTGTPVNGNVDITIKEIFTPAEMILNNMPAMSNGLPLESGGEFQVKATKAGAPLKLAPGNFIKIQMSQRGNINMNGMQVFNGVSDAEGNTNWVLNGNPGNFVVGDSLLFSNYSLFSDSINWINCDKFINQPVASFSVYPANAPSNDSTNVFVHLTGRNAVVKMNWTRGLSYFYSDKLLAIPSTIVGLSVRNGALYASITPIDVQNGGSVTMNFTPYTEEQLKARLALLR